MAVILRTYLLLCCVFTAISQKPLCRHVFAASDSWRDCRVTIGGLANKGPDVFQRTMGSAFEGYLTQVLNSTLGLEFEVLPLAFGEDHEHARNGTVDYIFTDSGDFSCLMAEFQLSAVASLVTHYKGHALEKFAGVIISRADSNFSTVEDLRRARVAVASIDLSAMQLQKAALLSLGLNIFTDTEQVVFTGTPDAVVQEVQNGWAEVGFVNFDAVDKMQDRGDTKWEYFQVINEIEDSSSPFRRSTDLIPEWPFGALPHVPADISKEVGIALMRLDRFSSDLLLSEPAISGSFVTFAPPKNYLDLLATLENIGYYSNSERHCIQAADLLDFVQCPSGWVKQKPGLANCPPQRCRSEYTCLCQPCVKLKDPELVLTAQALPTSWNPNVNETAVAAESLFASSCSRMSICAYMAKGQRISWRLVDQIGDAVRTEIGLRRLRSVEMLTELKGSWRPMTMESVLLDGVQTQHYVLEPPVMTVGEHIVQLRINGEQAAISPVVVDVFEPTQQAVDCPVGHRVETDGSCTACPAGSHGSELVDLVTGILMPSCVPCGSGRYQNLSGQAKCRRCSVGFISADEGSVACSECPPGKSTLGEEGLSVCTTCPAGKRKATVGGVKICEDCQAGTFTPTEGRSECEHCEPGTYSSAPGASRCNPCQPGYIAAQKGRSWCEKCPQGTFAEANSSTHCTSCGLNMTTRESGARSASLCRCPLGAFFVPGMGCARCSDRKEWRGLECPGGNDPPLQVAGYWVQVVDTSARDYSVYRCRDVQECPAGPLGHCAAGRHGQACNDCLDGYRSSDLGECSRCEGTSVLPLLGAGLGSIVALACLVLIVDMDRSKRSLNQLTVLMVSGQLVMAMQALLAVRQLVTEWVDPVKSILELLNVFSFDMDLLQVPCLFQSDNPMMKFGLQLLSYPCFVVFLLIICGIFRLCGRRISYDSMFNLNGIVLFMLFITITLTVLTPFQCAKNPNGTSYMSLNPGITCWRSDEHVMLVVMALVGTLAYPVSILSWTVWTTLQYPKRVQTGEGLRLIHRHRFLYERFSIECYYYGLLLLLRNAAVALVPVLLVAVPVAQLVVMSFVFLLGQTVQSRLWPWRTDLANRSDLATAVCLILVLTACAPLVSVEAEEDLRLLSNFLFVTVSAALISGLGAIAHGLFRRVVPLRTYQAFLCHHKAGAGSLCRYLKLMLTRVTDGKVFLDSDNLEDLDTLFEIVRCNCKTLIVVMTPEVLKRVWCAGEMVTAHRNKVHIVPVRCDGFLPLHEAGFGQVSNNWTREQKHMLANFGITMEHVQAAYKHVLELPFLTLVRGAPAHLHEEVVLELVDACRMSRKRFLGSVARTGRPRIVVIGAVADMEALATCQIVEFMVRRRVQVETMTLRNAQEAEAALGAFTHVILVLTRGVLSDPTFLEIFGLIGPCRGTPTEEHEFLVVNADPSFEFPDAKYYKRLARGRTPPGLPPQAGAWLADAYRTVFSILACSLTPHGSQKILNQQMDEVCSRTSLKNLRKSSSNITQSSLVGPSRSLVEVEFGPAETGASGISLQSTGEAHETSTAASTRKRMSGLSEDAQFSETTSSGTGPPCLGDDSLSKFSSSAGRVSKFRADVASRAAGTVVNNILL